MALTNVTYLNPKSSTLINTIETSFDCLAEVAETMLAACSTRPEALATGRLWLGNVCLCAAARAMLLDMTLTNAELQMLRDIAVYAEVLPQNCSLTNLRDSMTRKDSWFKDRQMEKSLLGGLAQFDLQEGTSHVKTAIKMLTALSENVLTLDGPLERMERDWLKHYTNSLEAQSEQGLYEMAGLSVDADSQSQRTDVDEEMELKSAASKVDFEISDKPAALEQAIEELNSLIGLSRAKAEVSQLIDFLKVQRLREQQGLPKTEASRHLVFYGNPGTGKTTVARLLSRIFCCLDLVSKGHLVEADRSTLVAGYLGQTAIKVRKVIQEARGGILFIDEAYSLTPDNSSDSFGQEAVSTLVKLMEDYREDLVVIVAGYPDKMDDFIHSNPGLRSRFNKYMHFDNYSPTDMLQIYQSMCAKSGFVLDSDAVSKLAVLFKKLHDCRLRDFGNAREVRNIFEDTLSHQASRLASLANPSRLALSTIVGADVRWQPQGN